MSSLKDLIEREIEDRLDTIIIKEVFPEFIKIAKHSVKKNYYDLYKPIQYERKYRLQNKWIIKKNKQTYEIYINENIKGKWNRQYYYLPQLVTEGKVIRKVKGKIVYIPRPFILDLKTDLNKNKIFQNLLLKYGISKN